MGVLIVIPARYESTRYPGKPLVQLKGANGTARSLIERSWRAAKEVSGVERVVVATDDVRIAEACEGFGGDVVMTSSTCANGTERCAETLRILDGGYDLVVNLQGDAPLTPPWFIEDLIKELRNTPDADVATPVLNCSGDMLANLLSDRAESRVGGTTAVFSRTRAGLYFSKEVIPFTTERYGSDDPTPVYHHVGVYAYRPTALSAYPSWPTGRLENLEGLEQLRFLEQNQTILCVEVSARGREFWELNNPEDVTKLEQMMLKMGMD